MTSGPLTSEPAPLRVTGLRRNGVCQPAGVARPVGEPASRSAEEEWEEESREGNTGGGTRTPDTRIMIPLL